MKVCNYVTVAQTVQSPWKFAIMLLVLIQFRAHESMSFCSLHWCPYSSEPMKVCQFVGCTVAQTVQSPWKYVILCSTLLPIQFRAHKRMPFCWLHCCKYSAKPMTVCHIRWPHFCQHTCLPCHCCTPRWSHIHPGRAGTCCSSSQSDLQTGANNYGKSGQSYVKMYPIISFFRFLGRSK